MLKPASLSIAGGAWVLLCLVGCTRQPAVPESPGTIAVAHSPLFGAAVATAALENGFRVIPATDDLDLGQNNIDAMVLPAGNKKAIRRAEAADIPVFTVALDDLGGGRTAAQAMHEGLGGTGRIAILDFPDDASAILRSQGFQQRLAELDTEMYVAAQLPGGRDRAQGFQATRTILLAQGALRGIFAVNPTAAAGARKALSEAGRSDDILLIVFSETPSAGPEPTLIPHTDAVASNTLHAIRDVFAGNPVSHQTLVPMTLVRNGSLP